MKYSFYIIFGLVMGCASLSFAHSASTNNQQSSKNYFQRQAEAYTAQTLKNLQEEAKKREERLALEKQQRILQYKQRSQQKAQAAKKEMEAKAAATQQAEAAKLQPILEHIKKLQEQAQKFVKLREVAEKKLTSTSPKATLCDCYDKNSPYNYPSNFIYNHNHIRVQRISPFCRCQVPAAIAKAAESVKVSKTPTVKQPISKPAKVIVKTTQPTPTKKPASFWHIDYD